MMSWLRGRARAAREGDAGVGMITVVIAMSLFLLLTMAILGQVVGGQTLARSGQDWNRALAAAQAGTDDYLSRLNNSNGDYYRFDGRTVQDPSNPALGQTAGSPNWAPVPQAGGSAGGAKFHYDVDLAYYVGGVDESGRTVQPNGTIKLTVTGSAGKRTRTLRSDIRRIGFLDNLYFSDFETKDPDSYRTYFPYDTNGDGDVDDVLDGRDKTWAGAPGNNCANKYYGTRSTSCTNIQFANDVLSGPVHSNDKILICNNAVFNAKVETARGRRTNDCASTAGTTFARTGDPKLVSAIEMPRTNSSLITQTAATTSPRGCLFVGETKIVIRGNTMRVTSPWTRSTPVCQKDTWTPLPANGVVYVDTAVVGVAGDPNNWTSAEAKPCDNTGAKSNSVGYPVTNEAHWDYPCGRGDVFIQEEAGDQANGLNGRLTVAAKGDLYITDDLEYAPGTDIAGGSLLGLIAENNVYYWHPIDAAGANLAVTGTTFKNRNVDAAMLSVLHSVTTMNYFAGSTLEKLNISGNMTQKYRGIVKRGSAGYDKNYLYDQRLLYDAPPHFLEPTISQFTAKRITETSPLYR
jgi:hypothetical protein